MEKATVRALIQEHRMASIEWGEAFNAAFGRNALHEPWSLRMRRPTLAEDERLTKAIDNCNAIEKRIIDGLA